MFSFPAFWRAEIAIPANRLNLNLKGYMRLPWSLVIVFSIKNTRKFAFMTIGLHEIAYWIGRP
jgi:hypothetical protein